MSERNEVRNVGLMGLVMVEVLSEVRKRRRRVEEKGRKRKNGIALVAEVA